MLTTVKGIYEKGTIIFDEQPPVTKRTEVIVTFLIEAEPEQLKKRMVGMLEGKAKLPDDFNEPLDALKDYM